jgi:transcriptional regulator with XRE-family HTH domain
MPRTKTPLAVNTAMRRIGEHLATWRKLRALTVAEVADRAGVSPRTVIRLEAGNDITSQNLLRIARALGVLDNLASAVDPYDTDLGRLRSEDSLPARVRPKRRGAS